MDNSPQNPLGQDRRQKVNEFLKIASGKGGEGRDERGRETQDGKGKETKPEVKVNPYLKIASAKEFVPSFTSQKLEGAGFAGGGFDPGMGSVQQMGAGMGAMDMGMGMGGPMGGPGMDPQQMQMMQMMQMQQMQGMPRGRGAGMMPAGKGMQGGQNMQGMNMQDQMTPQQLTQQQQQLASWAQQNMMPMNWGQMGQMPYGGYNAASMNMFSQAMPYSAMGMGPMGMGAMSHSWDVDDDKTLGELQLKEAKMCWLGVEFAPPVVWQDPRAYKAFKWTQDGVTRLFAELAVPDSTTVLSAFVDVDWDIQVQDAKKKLMSQLKDQIRALSTAEQMAISTSNSTAAVKNAKKELRLVFWGPRWGAQGFPVTDETATLRDIVQPYNTFEDENELAPLPVSIRARLVPTVPSTGAAAQRPDLLVKWLAEQAGVSLTAQDNDGKQPVHAACEQGHLELVRWLAEKEGVSLAAQDHEGRQPIHWACEQGHLEVVKWLSEQEGVSLAAQDNKGCQPIHEACFQGHLELVKWLAEQEGVSLAAKDNDGWQPIHNACSEGHLELVKWLAEQEGVSLAAEDSEGRQPIHWACIQGHLELVKWLAEQEGVSLAAEDSEDRQPIHWACIQGHLALVKWLAEQEGVSLTAKDNFGWQPIHWACKGGHLKVVKWLAEQERRGRGRGRGRGSERGRGRGRGVSLTAKDNTGSQPIHWACKGGHLELVKWLTEQEGVSLAAKDNDGWQPVHVACEQGHLELVRWLAEQEGVSLAAEDSEGRQPIHLACEQGHLELVKWLTEQEGVSLAAEDNFGWQPIHVACEQGYLELVRWLAEQEDVSLAAEDNCGRQPIHVACGAGNLELVRWLAAQECVSLAAEDNDGWQTVHHACLQGHLELVKWLAEQEGVSLTAQDNDGRQPIDVARRNSQFKVVEWLKETLEMREREIRRACELGDLEVIKTFAGQKGVSAVKDNDSRQPFHWACKGGHLELVRWLAEQEGVSLTAKDNTGRQPIHWACTPGHLELVKWLAEQEGVSLTVADNDGWQPIHLAFQGGHLELVKWLAEQECVSLAAERSSWLPVHLYVNTWLAKQEDAWRKKLIAENEVPELSAEDKTILDKLRSKNHISAKFRGVKVGLVQKCDKHPKSNKFVVLQVCYDPRFSQRSQVVCNTNKIEVGMKVAFAPVGAKVLFPDEFGFLTTVQPEIHKGMKSEGMLCSQKRLTLGDEDNAVLPKNFPVGIDVDEAYYRFGNAFKSEKAEIIKEMARLAEGKKAKTEAAAAKKAARAAAGIVEKNEEKELRKGTNIDPSMAAAAQEAERNQEKETDRQQKEGVCEDEKAKTGVEVEEVDERQGAGKGVGKVCSGCKERKQSLGFSSKQWKAKSHQRKCLVCAGSCGGGGGGGGLLVGEARSGQACSSVWIELKEKLLGEKTVNYSLTWMERMPTLEFTANVEEEDEDEDEIVQQAQRHALAANNDEDQEGIDGRHALVADNDETQEGIEEGAETMTEEKPGYTPELPALPLWTTDQVKKWYKGADERLKECFDTVMTKLSTRNWGRKISKPLEGFAAPINEAYLDQSRSALRILWTLVKEGGPSKILLWYVSKHKRVQHYAKQINVSLSRLNRRVATADSVRDENIEASSLHAGTLVIERDQLLLDPLANIPLKIWELPCADIQKLKEEGWEPPLRLTPQEEDVIKHMGTVLVEGRSGTGKTICIANKMSFDRQQSGCSHGQQLFVARSRRICSFVGSLQGHPGGFSGTQDTLGMKLQTLADLIEDVATALGLSDKFGTGARVDWCRFKSDIFPRARKSMKAGGGGLEALEVWKAMRSFIKGSIHSLKNDCEIDKDTYMGFGWKQVRLSEEKRQEAFKAYECVRNLYRNEGLWDDCDVVLAIHRTLRKGHEEGARKRLDRFYKVYVDEVQDLTTAELSLLLKMSANGLFLAGDPAQSVEEGVDFRYKEVRSLFYEQTSGNYMPEDPLKLHLNFRSHAGILEAADSILCWLNTFFPGSISALPNDKGLCTGPRPAMDVWSMSELSNVLLENASSDLTILSPDQNKDDLIKNIQESLSHRTDAASLENFVENRVMGIREAKGLDFNEVVIVDFFSSLDEKQQKSWQTFMHHSREHSPENHGWKSKAVGLGHDHPEVETHLKLLYTAMTRAKRRLYFIETKETKAARAFLEALSSEESQRLTQGLKTLKANELSPDEWAARGLDFAWKASDDGGSGLDQQIRDLDVAIESFGRAGPVGAAYKEKAVVHKDVLSLLLVSQQTDQASSSPLLQQDTENKVVELVQRCIAEGMWKEANLFLSSLPTAWKHCLRPDFENVFMHEWKQNVLPQDRSGDALL